MLYRLKDLQFAYGPVPVLKGISADFKAGESIAFVGPNGAGKSTLLKVLAALLRTYTGTVDFSGRSLAAYSPREVAQRVAFVPQETHMMFPFSVAEIIMMGRLPHRQKGLFESQLDMDRAHQAMEVTDTLGLGEKKFNQLSGG